MHYGELFAISRKFYLVECMVDIQMDSSWMHLHSRFYTVTDKPIQVFEKMLNYENVCNLFYWVDTFSCTTKILVRFQVNRVKVPDEAKNSFLHNKAKGM
jgi:hypothetical protein